LKTILTYLLVLFFTVSLKLVQGQERTSKAFTGINGSLEVNYYGIYASPYISSDRNRHSFSAGPLFNALPYYYLVPKKTDYFYPTKDRFIGGRVAYENIFLAPRRMKKINIFLHINLTYHYNIFSEFAQYPSKTIDKDYVNKSQFLGLYFGFGNKTFYRSGLFLNTSISWGATLYENLGAPPQFSVPDRGYLSNTMVIKFGVGYFL